MRGIASHSPDAAPTSAAAFPAPTAPKAASYDDDQERYMASQPQQSYEYQAPPQEPVQNQSFFLPGQQPASAYQQTQPQTHYAEPTQTRGFDAADSSAGLRENERTHSSYGDWMAPAAVGAGAGVAGTAAYNHLNNDNEPTAQPQQQQQQDIQPEPIAAGTRDLEDPVSAAPAPSDPTTTTNNIIPIPNYDNASAGTTTNPTNPSIVNTAPTTLNYGPAPTTTTAATNNTTSLGGHESAGAHETGRIFPSVVRHDTDISVSQLHVPGSFPRKN